MMTQTKKLSPYFFPLSLLLSIFAGGLVGCLLGPTTLWLKPIGDIFLNLLFVAIVPLIFFSIAAAVSRMGEARQLWRVLSATLLTFLFTGIVAALFMLLVVIIFPPAQGVFLQLDIPSKLHTINLAQQIVDMFTVNDFTKLFSHQNIFPLILFSVVVGLATARIGEKGKLFSQFLQSGSDVFMRVIGIIMYLAPLGFFAYFAVLIGDLGPKLLENYLRILLIYYLSGLLYFVLGLTFYAFLAGGKMGVKKFWGNIFLPLITSLATCSSAASIPANLQAAKNMTVPPSIYETVIPIGAVLHKDGSVLGGIVKIAFLFGIFHMSFTGFNVFFTAIIISLMVGMVMGAIPSGGMLGEMLILSFYGFPPQALIAIAAISVIIDPLATLLNVTGDTVSSMMVTRLIEGRAWVREKLTAFAPSY